jgi:hypothetical protein
MRATDLTVTQTPNTDNKPQALATTSNSIQPEENHKPVSVAILRAHAL